MKNLLIPLASVGLLAAPCALSASLLFEENWADRDAGSTAVSTGRWVMGVGAQSQFTIVTEPSGNAVSASYTPTATLPMMMTNEVFTMPETGIRLSADITFTGTAAPPGNYGGNYFRIGIQAANATNYTNNYWVEVWQPIFRVSKGTGTIVDLSTHYFSNEWVYGETANFAMTITPDGDGAHRIELLFNGEVVRTYLDSSGAIPDFSDGFKIIVAAREPRQGYISNIKLEAIPEGTSYALLAGGIGALWAAKRFGLAAAGK